MIEAGKLDRHFGAYGTACLDDAKKVVWSNRDLIVQHENGPGSSPVIWGDLLIFHCDGSDQQFIALTSRPANWLGRPNAAAR